jgi:hypothetical protein
MEIRPSDQILLYQDKRPLILLRDTPATAENPASQQLIFNFDPRLSNIENQPAFIVILLRFIEQIRARKVAPYQENLESGQPLALATRSPESGSVVRQEIDLMGKILASEPIDQIIPVQLPELPGFHRFVQGEEKLLEAATYFADTREADFRQCEEDNQLANAKTAAVQAHSKGDPLWHLWILCLITVLLLSWHYTRERNAVSSASQMSPAQ